MRYLRLAGLFLRIGVLNELQYRANFFVQIFETVLAMLVSIGGISIIFAHTGTLGGWKSDELLALVGIYFLVGGLINFIIQPSMQRLMEDVRTGTLDFMLTKPEDAQLLASIRQVQIWKLIDVILGLGLVILAVARVGVQVGAMQALGFGVALLAGGAIVYSFWLLLATLVFWFVRIDNILVIFQSVYEAGRWPVGIYPGWLQMVLTFLVPVAFAVTVPAEAVVGRLTPESLLGAVLLAVVMLTISRQFWRIGVRHYSGASA
ncbi:MAG: ABC-2 family transporter protein [Anaerolineae bacterium]|nr:ABC-2 family transporter protein [Anaerolineae bacterium]